MKNVSVACDDLALPVTRTTKRGPCVAFQSSLSLQRPEAVILGTTHTELYIRLLSFTSNPPAIASFHASACIPTPTTTAAAPLTITTSLIFARHVLVTSQVV